MKAAVIYGPGDVRVTDIPDPEPQKGDVLVKVRACGVCGTEHTLFMGGYYANFPVVLGHEFAGEIAAIGSDVRDLKVGDLVMVDPNIVCHRCEYCRMGSEHLCENLVTIGIHTNGGDADYCLVPQTNAYKLAETMTCEEGAFCEPLACVVRGFEVGPVQLGDTVLVLGAGPIGNLVMQCAVRAGAANVIVSEPLEIRRRIAKENGATHICDPTQEDVNSVLRRFRRIGADVIFECAGRLSVQSSALSLIRKGGTLVLFGVSPKGGQIQFSPFDVNENEIKIVGSFNNPNTQAQALQLLASRAIRVDNLVTHRVQLPDYPAVFDLFGKADTMKIMTVMDG